MQNTELKKNRQNTSVRLLVEKREKLFLKISKLEPSSFMRQSAEIIDEYFFDSFETSMVGPQMGINRKPYAIIALGGYGRAEQCVHSDVDLLFLFKDKVPPVAEKLIQEIIYPLWDAGMEVGYATRSVKECIRIAETDLETMTAILDSRFICGMSNLFLDLMDQFREKISKSKPKRIMKKLIESSMERHSNFGDSTSLLEPNLKLGKGGLRDYHTIMWLSKIKFDLKQPRDLEYYGYLSESEYQKTTEALSFVWNVRNRLHLMAGRKCDQLHFEYQMELAENLKFKSKRGQQPVELFLGHLHSRMDLIKELHLMLIDEIGRTPRLGLKRKNVKKAKNSHFKIVDGMLNFVASEDIVKNPELLLEIFLESAVLQTPLSPESKRLVTDFKHLVDKKLKKIPDGVRTFDKILSATPYKYNVLGEMLKTGVLERIIPEFSGIVNRIQYNQYHLYPVSQHTLKTVKKLKQFKLRGNTESEYLYNKIFKEIKHKRNLYMAGLFHDIGKGETGNNHSKSGARLTRNIMTRLGYGFDDIETVSFLVSEHLFLIKIATRRDINDEETALFCAMQIKDVERLKMLYLLTVADSMSTGPKAWSSWTETLLMNLFFKILGILEKGESPSSRSIGNMQDKKERVLRSAPVKKAKIELERVFDGMSSRYILETEAEKIIGHIELSKGLDEDCFVWKIETPEGSNTRVVTVMSQDTPGLFSKIAGVLALNNFDILEAQASSWQAGIALSIFKTKAPPDLVFEDEKWEKTGKQLRELIQGKMDLERAYADKIRSAGSFKTEHVQKVAPHVRIDNECSSFYTIIEVITYDAHGLLYKITDALLKCGLDVMFAKIATKIDQVVDVFYVRDIENEKADSPDQVEMIKTTINDVLKDDAHLKEFESGNVSFSA